MKIDLTNYKNYSLIYDTVAAKDSFAATELNNYVNKVCGFSFTINEKTENFVYVGYNAVLASGMLAVDEVPLKQDGFRIAFKNGNIFIFGNSNQGTFFGVYEFIERFLGVKWLNIDTTYIPTKTNIEIEEIDIVKAPLFPQRVFFTAQYLALNPENSKENSALISAHHKLNFPEKHLENFYGNNSKWFRGFPEPHNSNYYVTQKEWEKDFPEFFFKSPAGGIELCYSNGINDDYFIDETKENSVVKASAKTLFNLIKQNPKVEYYSFGRIDDRTALCHCSLCERRRKELGGETGIMMVFFNAVIKETERLLEKENIKSDFKIVTLAYQNTEEPPVKDGMPVHPAVIPTKRLHIRYAPISADYTYSLKDIRQKAVIRDRIFGWAKITSNLMIWDYQVNYTDYCWYFPNLSYFKENLQLYNDIGVTYLFNQSAYNINRHWQDEMSSYIASKLYWDLSLDVNELRDEYISLCYGVAGEEVKQFVCLMDKFFAEKIENGFHLDLFIDTPNFFAPKEYPLDFLLNCISILEKGLQKIRKSDYSLEEKTKRERDFSRVLLTPLRMLARNVDYYYPNQETDYEQRVFKLAKLVGLNKIGEGVPLFVDLVKEGECKHKIVLGQQYTEFEKEGALELQKQFKEISGIQLEIVQDDKVYPAYNQYAICVGNGMMVREFYKGSVNVSDYEYFVDVRGRVLFLFGNGSLLKGVKVLLSQLIFDSNNIIMPMTHKEKKLEC